MFLTYLISEKSKKFTSQEWKWRPTDVPRQLNHCKYIFFNLFIIILLFYLIHQYHPSKYTSLMSTLSKDKSKIKSFLDKKVSKTYKGEYIWRSGEKLWKIWHQKEIFLILFHSFNSNPPPLIQWIWPPNKMYSAQSYLTFFKRGESKKGVGGWIWQENIHPWIIHNIIKINFKYGYQASRPYHYHRLKLL